MTAKILQFKAKNSKPEKEKKIITNNLKINPVSFSQDEIEEMIKQTFKNLTKQKD